MRSLYCTSGRLSVAGGGDCTERVGTRVTTDATDAAQDVNLDIGDGISAWTDIIFQLKHAETDIDDR